MLSALLFLAPALASATINSIGYGPHGLELNAGESDYAASAYQDVALKEICYRNLYADVAAFKVKYQKEVLVSDKQAGQVYLADGTRKDENNVEFYYEEFCYKQYKVKEGNADYSQVSGISVGKRSLIESLGFSNLGGLNLDSDDSRPPCDLGIFNKGSFLDSFANSYGDGSVRGDAFGSLGGGFSGGEYGLGAKNSAPVSAKPAPHADDGSIGGAEQVKMDDKGTAQDDSPKERRAFAWYRLVVRGRMSS